MLLFAFAQKEWMMYAILAIYCLGGIAGPALQSVISSKVSPKEQGDLQGALTSVISITSIIGPLLMTQIFYFFTHPDAKIKLLTLELKPPFQFSGAPFFLGFVLMAVSAYFVYYVFHRKK
jgi:DHA1 family tetracycline resistance protein-like MFS transporter